MGLLYSTKPKNIQSDLLETLKEAISISLVHFYPLAGRFTTEELPDENAKVVYVDCTKGSGVLLIHATVDNTVSDIVSSVDVPLISRCFFDLGEKTINHDAHTRPLLSIQVTELIDGVFIGFTMNHSIVDGTSHWEYVNSLSEIFLQLSKIKNNEIDNIPNISKKPVFKPYFPDGWGPVLKLSLNGSVPRFPDEVGLRVRIFHFSSKSISKLKATANEEREGNNNTISSFQALSAFMWRSITRARNLTPDSMTSCALIVNVRPRLIPPLTNNYFGNFITRGQTKANVSEILNNGLGYAAMLINDVVVNQDANKIRGFYEWLVKFLSQGPIDDSGTSDKSNFVVMAGSPRYDTNGPEFGLGKAEAVLNGFCNKEDGKVVSTAGREGGGSVDLEVCLKAQTMNALESDDEFMSYVTLA